MKCEHVVTTCPKKTLSRSSNASQESMDWLVCCCVFLFHVDACIFQEIHNSAQYTTKICALTFKPKKHWQANTLDKHACSRANHGRLDKMIVNAEANKAYTCSHNAPNGNWNEMEIEFNWPRTCAHWKRLSVYSDFSFEFYEFRPFGRSSHLNRSYIAELCLALIFC